jgi:hypothetical protein
MSLGEYRTAVENRREEYSELGAAEMARKELEGTKKTLCVIRSYCETLINPLPGYD